MAINRAMAKVKAVKRIERGSKGGAQPTGSHLVDADLELKLSEHYTCTGKFADDFVELCRRKRLLRIPPVLLRPVRPYQVPSVDAKHEKAAKGSKATAQTALSHNDSEMGDGNPAENVDVPAKTFLMVENGEFTRPKIHVVQEHPDKSDTVTEVFIHGWRVDATILEILQQAWTRMEKLHTIHLWGTGITAASIEALSELLPQCACVKTLYLEANPVSEENYHALIRPNSHLTHLSLRNNRITDKGAASLALQLSSLNVQNGFLLQLNLSNNVIGDAGGLELARALRLNRTLLSLNLAGNQIGDEAAIVFARVISKIFLNHEEVVARRRMLDERSPEGGKSAPSSRKEKGRPDSKGLTYHAGDKAKREKSGKRKDSKEDANAKSLKAITKKDEKGAKKGGARPANTIGANSTSDDLKKSKGGKGDLLKKPGKEGGRKLSVALNQLGIHEVVHPFLEDEEFVEKIGDQIMIPGNRMLINLNLSRNCIDVKGLDEFVLAIKYQKTLTRVLQRGGTGLMRLLLNNNLVPMDHESMKNLHALTSTLNHKSDLASTAG